MTKKRRTRVIILAVLLGLASPALAMAIASRVLGPRLHDHVLTALHKVAADSALGDGVHIGLNGHVTVGPVDMQWPAGSLVRHVQITRLTVTPVFGSIFSGSPRIASVRADGVVVELEKVSGTTHTAATNAVRKALAERLEPFLREPLSITATDIYIHASAGEHREVELTLASIEANAACHSTCTADAHVMFEHGGEVTATIATETNLNDPEAFDDQVVTGTFHVIGLPLASLPDQLTRNVDRDHGRIDASIAVDFRLVSGKLASIDGQLGMSGQEIVLDVSRLDDQPVVVKAASAGANIHYRVREKRLGIHDAYVGLGNDTRVRLRFDAAVEVAEPYRTTLKSRAIGVPFDPLLASLPQQLRPEATDPQPHGELDAWADFEGPLGDPNAWKVAGDVDVKSAKGDKPTGAEALRGAFTHHLTDDNGSPREIFVGHSNDAYVAIADLPAHVTRAITTAEDGGFFGHHGFDFVEIKNAIAEKTSTGKVRGGSTLTQQLAKNLYLSSAKTYSRKVREALIALALEGTLTKQRMLEIYVNIIEWGPGLYGIGPAAQRYFGKPPSALSAKEAAYLASIIPNPVRYYGYYARGELSDTWKQRVNDILDKLHTTGVLDDATYADQVTAPIAFAGR